MGQGSQPYRELGDGFSSQAWQAGSAVAGRVSPSSVSHLVRRQGWHSPHSKWEAELVCPLQHHWVFNPAAWVAQARDFISSALAVGVSGGELRSNEIPAALKFTSKYLIREMFDFNNKWAEYQETRVLAKYTYGKVFAMGAFFALPS